MAKYKDSIEWEEAQKQERLEEERQERGERFKVLAIGIGIFLGLFLILTISLSWFVVSAGKVGVITHFGAVDRVAYPGLGWKVPYIEGIEVMDVRTQKTEIDVGAASKDLQAVSATIAVNFHLQGEHAVDVYQNVGKAYNELVILPAIQNAFKATTALYTAEELISKRNEVSAMAEENLQLQLNQYFITVETLNIINFDFSAEFNAAIEQKQVAQQQVEKSKQELARAKVEAETLLTQAKAQADAKIIVAQGEAESQKVLKDTGGLTMEYLQYLFLGKWNGALPQITSGDFSALLDVSTYLSK